MSFFLGLDVGTSSAKAVIVDESGTFHALERSEYDILCPHSGWAEQEPETWWSAICTAVQRTLSSFGRSPSEICGVAVSSQMHTLVALDASDHPVRPAILHNDARTAAQLQTMRLQLGAGAEARLCNPICNGMTVPSLLWIRDTEPSHYDQIAHVLLPADYIRLRLTGEHSSDHSNASSTLAYDVALGTWSDDTLRALDLPRSFFSPCYDSTDLAGRITPEAAAQCGLAAGTAVYFGGADQVMQSIGCGSIRPGQATVNLGSGAQVCIQTDHLAPAPDAGLNAFLSYRKDKWYTMAANSNGGSAFKWICRNILKEPDYDAVDRAIAAVRPGADGLLFLPYLNGERCPHRNPDLSGCFLGLTYLTDPARMARAVMEGVTFSLLDCLNACRNAGFSPDRLIVLGGGAVSPVWLQMQADIYNLPVMRTRSQEQAVLGAAICAAAGSGAFSSVEEACGASVPSYDDPVLPNQESHKIYESYYFYYRQFFAATHESLEGITRLGRS